MREKLGISFVPQVFPAALLNKSLAYRPKMQDEMRSMIMGLNFLIHNTKKEIFTYKDHKQVSSLKLLSSSLVNKLLLSLSLRNS